MKEEEGRTVEQILGEMGDMFAELGRTKFMTFVSVAKESNVPSTLHLAKKGFELEHSKSRDEKFSKDFTREVLGLEGLNDEEVLYKLARADAISNIKRLSELDPNSDQYLKVRKIAQSVLGVMILMEGQVGGGIRAFGKIIRVTKGQMVRHSLHLADLDLQLEEAMLNPTVQANIAKYAALVESGESNTF